MVDRVCLGSTRTSCGCVYPAAMTFLTDLDQLSDQALLRLLPSDQLITASEKLILAWDKLASQFAREGRLQSAAAQILAQGQLLLLAWEGPALSGCSHDKIHGLLRHCSGLAGSAAYLLRTAVGAAEGPARRSGVLH